MSRRVFVFGIIVVGLLVFSLYRAKYGAKDTAAELMAVEAAIEDAQHEKAMLETDLSHMSRREWIEEYARNELGMAPPRPDQIAREEELDLLVGPPRQIGAERLSGDVEDEGADAEAPEE